MIYGYARVSTKGQAKEGNSLEAQTAALTAAGAEKIYTDVMTGARADRPGLTQLLAAIGPGDTLMVTKLDRIARSGRNGAELFEDLLSRGATVHILNLGKMDDTPTGKLIRNVMLCFAEFERDLIAERTAEGKALARQKPGFREGRPKKYRPVQMDHAMALLDNGYSYRQVANITGISVSTLVRARQEQRAVRESDIRSKSTTKK